MPFILSILEPHQGYKLKNSGCRTVTEALRKTWLGKKDISKVKIQESMEK